jgi:hypothetical protein
MSKIAFSVLAAHIVSVALTHANPGGISKRAQSLAIQAAAAVSYGILVAFARPVPKLAAIFGGFIVASLVVQSLFQWFFGRHVRNKDEIVSRWDAAMWAFSATSLLGVAWYAAIPRTWGWPVRHIGLLTIYIAALPLLNSLSGLTSTRFDETILQQSWTVSQMAYTNMRTDLVPDAEYIHDPVTGTRVGIGSISGDSYIFFSGTDSTVDWLRTNMDVATTDYPSEWMSCSSRATSGPRPRVHRGFVKAYSAVRTAVHALLSEQLVKRGGSGKVVIVGHSLGGALAMVAAPDIACLLKDTSSQDAQLTVVTYGAPHVGDATFAHVFDELVAHSARVRTLYDPVPLALSGQFTHVKGEIVMSALGVDNPVTTFGLAAGKGIGSAHFEAYEQALKSSHTERLAYAFLPLAATLAAFGVITWIF